MQYIVCLKKEKIMPWHTPYSCAPGKKLWYMTAGLWAGNLRAGTVNDHFQLVTLPFCGKKWMGKYVYLVITENKYHFHCRTILTSDWIESGQIWFRHICSHYTEILHMVIESYGHLWSIMLDGQIWGSSRHYRYYAVPLLRPLRRWYWLQLSNYRLPWPSIAT